MVVCGSVSQYIYFLEQTIKKLKQQRKSREIQKQTKTQAQTQTHTQTQTQTMPEQAQVPTTNVLNVHIDADRLMQCFQTLFSRVASKDDTQESGANSTE